MPFSIPSSSTYTTPFWLVGSDGTSPDTGASNDSVILYVGASGVTFVPNLLVTAVHAAAGQYRVALTPSETSAIGALHGYHTQGAFAMPIFEIDVIRGSLSTFAASTDSVGLKAVVHSQATIGGIDNVANFPASGGSSGDQIATAVWNTAVAGYASTASFGGALSRFSSSAESVGLKAVTHSGATLGGINNIAAGVYSGVTIGGSSFVTINPGIYSNVTVQTENTSGGSTAAQIADAVWDEAQSGHRAAGSFGLSLQLPSLGSRTRGATTSLVTLGSGETTLDNALNSFLVTFLYDSGHMASGVISDYSGSMQSIALQEPVAVAPSSATYWLTPLPPSARTIDSVLTIYDITPKTYSGVTVESLNASASSSPTQIATAVWNAAVTGYASTASFGGALSRFSSSADSIGLKAVTHSAATIGGIVNYSNLSGDKSSILTVGVGIAKPSAVSVRLESLDYSSGVTVGVGSIKAETYSGVTVGAANASTSSTAAEIATVVWSVASGTYSGLTVRVEPILYSGLTVGINNIGAGAYSGVTIQGLTNFSNLSGTVSNLTVDVRPASILSYNLGNSRRVEEALFVLRNKVDASSSVGTVYKTDDATSAFTFSVSTGVSPIAAVDPAT